MASKLEHLADELLMDQLGSINEALDELDKRLEVLDRVQQKREQLLKARNALMQESTPRATNSGSRLTIEALLLYVQDNGPVSVKQAAEDLGVSPASIRSQLSRYKEKFSRTREGYKLS